MKTKFTKIHFFPLTLLIILSCEAMTPNDVINDYKIFYVPEYVVKTIEIPLPMLESSDSVAQLVVDYINIYNNTEQYVDLFSFSDIDSFDYNSELPWVKKNQTAEGTEITVMLFIENIIYNIENHINCSWDVQISGIDTLNGKIYDNWRSISANMFDGEETGLTLYDENGINSYKVYWNSQTAYQDNYRINYFKGDSITYMIRFEIDSYSNRFRKRVDTRGWGSEYSSWLEYSVLWFPDGQGEWAQYSEDGEEVASGSW